MTDMWVTYTMDTLNKGPVHILAMTGEMAQDFIMLRMTQELKSMNCLSLFTKFSI